MPNMVRHGTCQHNYAVERGLVVLWSSTLLYPTLLFDNQVLIYLVTHGLCSTISRQAKKSMPCKSACKCGLAQSPYCDCGQRQTMNHIANTFTLTKFELWRQTKTTPWSRWWCCHMAGINSDHSTHEMKWNELFLRWVTVWPRCNKCTDRITMPSPCNRDVREVFAKEVTLWRT